MATTTDTPDQTPAAAFADRRPGWSRWLVSGTDGTRLHLLPALLAAAAAGGLLLLAFPPFGLWWLAPVAVALFTAACHRRRLRGGFGIGMVAGLAFFAPLLSWTSTQVGEVPWVALSLLEALYLALLGGAVAYTSRLIDDRPNLLPLVTAALWTGQEALRGRTPFGGFPWGRLAFSQADSPLAHFAWLAGAPAVTFVTAGCGGLLALAVWRWWGDGARWGKPRPSRRAAISAALAVVALLAGLAVPTWLTAPAGDKITVAVVQGNVPRIGLDFNEQRRAVLDNHVAATIELAGQVADGSKPQPSLVVWPENASDIDPLANPDAAAEIDAAARHIGAPIVLGTLQRDGNQIRNISLVWDPEDGPGFSYVKQHPVPFAEYIPIKPVVRTVAGWIDERMVDGIDRVHGFVPGEEPGVIPVADLTLSGIICFEVAYDDLVRESVTEGAQILAVQTNNATFNDAEARQQMAMVQLRSIEHGRSGLMASTVGVSGFTDASGAVTQPTEFNTADVLVAQLPISEAMTPATFLGVVPELVASALALGILVLAFARRRGAGAIRP